ncbi:alpha/beta hydrolase [Allokutzneria sp. A3M-2-11 16]|uniref:alpha/beta fold hydrolase n=1 Tax=Allokutzneria sp. A3M-2-11 16 TaxID=2962043 RepID=UPI0020B8C3D5|nr:alpha/beta hydrolase [Allokutzneria sp. A3M-2-11 16]MCP3802901.1 alpha/beta hydrolase [Allokutzneria sp. A3M-2-11 16]
MPQTVRSADGTPIAYDRLGDGPPLIYVGGATMTRNSDPELPKLLAEHFTVYCFDRRGRGDSGDPMAPGAPAQNEEQAAAGEVEDVAALIAEAGGAAMLYGMSSGGALALEATASGLPVTRLAIYEAPFAEDTPAQRKGAAEYATRLTQLLFEGRRGDAVALFMSITGMPDETIEQIKNMQTWPAMEAVAPSLAYDAAVLRYYSRGGTVPLESLAAVTVPTLAMSGGDSPAFFGSAAQKIADGVLNGEHRVLAGQTHYVDPHVLSAALIEFLR